jgi:uncharacterized MAPEG superfamily protein
MTFALWTILAAAILPLLATSIAKAGGSGYDNASPRTWETRLSGWRARANWAHRNHMEAFPVFAAAVLVAQVAHGPQGVIDGLAAVFILARVGYTAAYVMDKATLRSGFWFVGFVCDVLLFCTPLLHGS